VSDPLWGAGGGGKPLPPVCHSRRMRAKNVRPVNCLACCQISLLQRARTSDKATTEKGQSPEKGKNLQIFPKKEFFYRIHLVVVLQ